MISKNVAAPAMASLCLLFGTSAWAGPNATVYTPTVIYGEREIDFKAGVQRNRDGSSKAAHTLGFGFTPTTWWFTEIEGEFVRAPGKSSEFEAWAWENRFALTEPGQYPIDLGLFLEIERPDDRAEGYELIFGPMLQAERGKFQGNFNVFFEKKHLRSDQPSETELEYQVQLKYRHSEQLEWGLQGFGNVGEWDHWKDASEQEFKVGPALFGKFRVGGQHAIEWNAAVLRGTTNATPTTTYRFQAEYEF